MLKGALIGLCAGLAVALVGFVVALLKTAKGLVFPAKALTCITRMSPSDVLQAVRALGNPYKVDESSTIPDCVVLSTAPGFSTFGFFFPVRATSHPDGSTLVEVGCVSKVPASGPVVDRMHAEALAKVRAAVGGT